MPSRSLALRYVQPRLCAAVEATTEASLAAGMPFVLLDGGCWMLKITVVDEGAGQKFLVEGKLVAPCVSELELLWNQARQAGRTSKIVVDLSGTTDIDPCGKAALVAMIREGARLTAKGIYSRYVADQLMTDAGASRRKHNKAISVESNSAGSLSPTRQTAELPDTGNPALPQTNRRANKRESLCVTLKEKQ
jgi:hypothetical protein